MTPQPRSPDWYPDPSGKPGLMYWDGQQWHNNIHETPARAERPPAETAATTPRFQRNSVVLATLCAAIAVLAGAAAILGYLVLKQPHQPQTPAAEPAPAPRQIPPPAPTSAPPPAPSYFKTAWGTSCRVTAQQVTCQSCVPGQVITNAYTCSDPAPGVAVNTTGLVDHDPGDTGSSPDFQQLASGQTYHAVGWTIEVSGGWVHFTNDTTGHGMAVAAQNFDSF